MRRRAGDNTGSTNFNNEESLADNNIMIPDVCRGVYFGVYGQPVYEKAIKLGRPSSSQVLVQVKAVGLNPVDAKEVIGDKLSYSWKRLRRWAHNLMVKDTRVGFDFAGIVAQSHPYFERGTRVYGTMPPLKGSCADFIHVPIHQIAKAPSALTFEECAALPLVGLTAWQSLSPYIIPGRSRVLVVGGSGGTGHVALQVAKALEAEHVTTLCSTSNIDFVRECGANHVVDYSKSTDIINDLRKSGPFDIVLDCVTSADPKDAGLGYPSSIRGAPRLLTDNALYQRLGGKPSDWIRASLARPNIFPHSWLWRDPRERLFWIKFPHSQPGLNALARMADAGKLKPKIKSVYSGISATNVQNAFEDILSRRVRGKIVVKVAE